LAASNYSPAARAALASQVGFTTELVAVSVADVAGLIPAGGTGMAAGAYDTAMNRDTALTTIGELKTSLNALAAGLNTMGLPITVT